MKHTSHLLSAVLLLLSTSAFGASLDAGPDGARDASTDIVDSGAVDSGAVDSGTLDAGSLCGNGRIDGREQCDGIRFKGATCSSATMGAKPSGTLACSDGCMLILAGCTSSTGSDGATGAGGAGAGGDNGAGGLATSGGTTSSSGGVRSSSGGVTAAPDAGTGAKSGNDSGCGCRVADQSTENHGRAGLAALALVGLLAARRRRARG